MVKSGKGPKKDNKKSFDRLINTISTQHNIKKSQIKKEFSEFLKQKYHISLDKKPDLAVKKLLIPIEIFSTTLSGLEALVKYLHENKKQTFSQIAKLLNRDPTTIWTTYHNTTKKQQQLTIKNNEQTIPIETFNNRTLSIFEWVIHTLKQSGLKYVDIAKLLNRDQRNIWSTFNRAQKKLTKFSRSKT